MCYVGKATKIFFFVIAILAILGLILGLGIASHSWGRKALPSSCQTPNCRPIYADPIPADASTPPNPTTTTTTTTTPPPPPPPDSLLNPIINPTPPNPTPNPTANPTVATGNSAAPPPFVGFGPPSPFSIALGPGQG